MTAVIEVSVNLVDRVWLTIERNINKDAAGRRYQHRVVLAFIFTTVAITRVVCIHAVIIPYIYAQATISVDSVAPNLVLDGETCNIRGQDHAVNTGMSNHVCLAYGRTAHNIGNGCPCQLNTITGLGQRCHTIFANPNVIPLDDIGFAAVHTNAKTVAADHIASQKVCSPNNIVVPTNIDTT